MLPSATFQDTAATLMAADTAWLAEATPFVSLHLAQNDFTPSINMSLTDFVECTFTGYAAKNAASAATQVFFDPATTQKVMQVQEPAGGWHFVCSGTPATPQQVTGYYLTDSGATKLIGFGRLDNPIASIMNGMAVDIDQVRFTLSLDALS